MIIVDDNLYSITKGILQISSVGKYDNSEKEFCYSVPKRDFLLRSVVYLII